MSAVRALASPSTLRPASAPSLGRSARSIVSVLSRLSTPLCEDSHSRHHSHVSRPLPRSTGRERAVLPLQRRSRLRARDARLSCLDARGHASSLRVQPLSGVPLLAHSLCDSTAAVATHTHTHEHMNMVHTHGTTRTTHAACGRRLVRTGYRSHALHPSLTAGLRLTHAMSHVLSS